MNQIMRRSQLVDSFAGSPESLPSALAAVHLRGIPDASIAS